MNDYEELDATALAVLGLYGPLSDEQWAAKMVEYGHGDEAEMFELIDTFESDERGFFEDGRNIHLRTLLEGRVLTHRVTDREVSADIVEIGNEFTTMTGLLDTTAEQRGYAVVSTFTTPSAVFRERGITDPGWPTEGLMLPRGTLAGFRPGDVLGLTVENGQVETRRITRTLADLEVGDELLELVGDGSAYIDALVWQLMYENPSLFREATIPIPEILEAAGLAIDVDFVARRGFDFAAERQRTSANMLARTFDIDDAESSVLDAFLTLVQAAAHVSGEDRIQLIREAVEVDTDSWARLSDPYVARAALQLIVRMDRGVPALAAVATALVSLVPRSARASVHWLHARAVDLIGDPEAAERSLQRAVDLDPTFVTACLERAEFAFLRGEAAQGLSVLRSIGSAEGAQELRSMLEELLPREHPGLGRNDRCWCGSGRKYKVCHLGKSDATPQQRARWLYAKADQFLAAGRGEKELRALADIRTTFWDETDDPLSQALEGDPFILDALLFEGGLFADFVEERGPLLPPDELNLAQQWLLIERSVHEVESITPGEGMSLRDVRTGDRQIVTERTASRELKPGQFICTRVVPVGPELQCYGGIEPVHPSQRHHLINMLDNHVEPEDLVDFLSARFAPPTISSREGDPIVLCEAQFELGELNSIRRKLSRAYGAADGNRWHWRDGASILGILTLDGTQLTVEAMTESRFDRIIDAVTSMHPMLTVVHETRTPPSSREAELKRAGSGHVEQDLDLENSPEVVSFLEEQIRKYEASWIHEKIPALDGYTPTQAAADPTRREDLIRLINSFPETGHPGAMSPRRLLLALGLDDGSAFWRAQR
ncbi:MAG: SEC-C domain-containing protein [Rhodococcus sp. (in: high G+C Gram-positive bacteria)]